MSVFAFVGAIFLSVVLAAIGSISWTVWLALGIACAALCFVVAKANIKNTASKLGLAILGCVVIIALVVFAHVSRFVDQEITEPLRIAEAVKAETDSLLASRDPQRFSKALKITQTLENQDRRFAATLELHYAMAQLNGADELASTEVDAAIGAARYARMCPEFVPTALVRQIQPAELLQTLQRWSDRNDCQGVDEKLLRLVIERCRGPWAARCATELPFDGLITQANLRQHADSRFPNREVDVLTGRAYATRKLIATVWPQKAEKLGFSAR